MLDKYNYHHYQYSYYVINRVTYYCIAWTEGRAAQRDSLAQSGIDLGALHQFRGPSPVKSTGFA